MVPGSTTNGSAHTHRLQERIHILVKIQHIFHSNAYPSFQERRKQKVLRKVERWKSSCQSQHYSSTFHKQLAWQFWVLRYIAHMKHRQWTLSFQKFFHMCDNCKKSAPSMGCTFSEGLTRNTRAKRKLSNLFLGDWGNLWKHVILTTGPPMWVLNMKYLRYRKTQRKTLT